jgi:hypothetical protein
MNARNRDRTQELARIAPNVVYLFKRPKVIQASQFMAVIEVLVTFAKDPEVFFGDFRALTVRTLSASASLVPDYSKQVLYISNFWDTPAPGSLSVYPISFSSSQVHFCWPL